MGAAAVETPAAEAAGAAATPEMSATSEYVGAEVEVAEAMSERASAAEAEVEATWDDDCPSRSHSARLPLRCPSR